jgi:hypothetical protein
VLDERGFEVGKARREEPERLGARLYGKRQPTRRREELEHRLRRLLADHPKRAVGEHQAHAPGRRPAAGIAEIEHVVEPALAAVGPEEAELDPHLVVARDRHRQQAHERRLEPDRRAAADAGARRERRRHVVAPGDEGEARHALEQAHQERRRHASLPVIVVVAPTDVVIADPIEGRGLIGRQETRGAKRLRPELHELHHRARLVGGLRARDARLDRDPAPPGFSTSPKSSRKLRGVTAAFRRAHAESSSINADRAPLGVPRGEIGRSRNGPSSRGIHPSARAWISWASRQHMRSGSLSSRISGNGGRYPERPRAGLPASMRSSACSRCHPAGAERKRSSADDGAGRGRLATALRHRTPRRDRHHRADALRSQQRLGQELRRAARRRIPSRRAPPRETARQGIGVACSRGRPDTSRAGTLDSTSCQAHDAS